MIELEINGQRFEGFKQISARRSYMAVPGDFSFVATTNPENLSTFPIEEGAPCRVIVNGQPFITGHIDLMNIVHDEDRHEISVEGLSAVADLAASTMDGRFEINGPISLVAALKKVMSLAGSDLTLIDHSEGVPDFGADEVLSGKIGDPVWGFMVELAIKKQVLLTENCKGEIIITRGGGKRLHDKLIKIPNGRENNILGSTSIRSQRSRFSKYTVLSQEDSISLENIDPENFDVYSSAFITGAAEDREIRATRLQCIVAEQSSKADDCKKRAIWQSNISRVNGFAYRCNLQGFTSESGEIWEPGQVVHVRDDYQKINADLITDSISLSYSEQGGSITKASWLLPDAFTLTAEKPTVSDTGNDYSGFFK